MWLCLQSRNQAFPKKIIMKFVITDHENPIVGKFSKGLGGGGLHKWQIFTIMNSAYSKKVLEKVQVQERHPT